MTSTASSSVGSSTDIFSNLTPKSTAPKTTDEAQDRFLKLYVTQLKNQDPLNPLDNAQVTSQLAQLNTVKGIESLNATLNRLMEAFTGNQTLQAASMIGKNVLVPGAQMTLQDGLAVAGFELPQAVDKLSARIFDSNGLLMRTLELGARDAGSAVFAWDGVTDGGASAVNGKYRITLDALSGGKAAGVNPLELGTVNAVVRPGTAGGSLQLDLGAAGTVDLGDVRRIL